MQKEIDLIGKKFGNLTVIAEAPPYILPEGKEQLRWECQCSCGNKIIVTGVDLKKENQKSCSKCALKNTFTIPLASANKKLEICTDHTGKEHSNAKSMCEYWGIKYSTYCSRKRKGWSLEEALTPPLTNSGRKLKTCMDHTGKEYPNVDSMCESWGIKYSAYAYRKRKGWPLQEILTTPVATTGRKLETCTDHTGKEYSNLKSMCDHWNINYVTYCSRINRNWSIEKALTTPIAEVGKNTKTCIDHTGKEHKNIKSMCQYWGIKYVTYCSKKRNGYSLKEILTTEGRKLETWVDHTGKEYPNVDSMCESWGIKYSTYAYRKRKGWPLQEILTTPVATTGRKLETCTDHTGKEYPNGKSMCQYWGINYTTYYERKQSGWSTEEALTTPVNQAHRTSYVKDHTGKEYKSIESICKHYGIKYHTYYDRQRRGWSLEKILTTPVK